MILLFNYLSLIAIKSTGNQLTLNNLSHDYISRFIISVHTKKLQLIRFEASVNKRHLKEKGLFCEDNKRLCMQELIFGWLG